jgi:hypothetical protein
MAIGPRLDLRQSQSLVMTPQLRQAIKLLQFSNLEVAAFVEEELERNPLLERDERPEIPPERPSLPAPTTSPPRMPDRSIRPIPSRTIPAVPRTAHRSAGGAPLISQTMNGALRISPPPLAAVANICRSSFASPSPTASTG